MVILLSSSLIRIKEGAFVLVPTTVQYKLVIHALVFSPFCQTGSGKRWLYLLCVYLEKLQNRTSLNHVCGAGVFCRYQTKSMASHLVNYTNRVFKSFMLLLFCSFVLFLLLEVFFIYSFFLSAVRGTDIVLSQVALTSSSTIQVLKRNKI